LNARLWALGNSSAPASASVKTIRGTLRVPPTGVGDALVVSVLAT
jgi:hypothetical protein